MDGALCAADLDGEDERARCVGQVEIGVGASVMMDDAPLTAADLDATVARCVLEVEAIDVDTHLLPPTHGALLLFGIDEILVYHYLVAELFMVLPVDSGLHSMESEPRSRPPSPDEFFALPKELQADLVFEELFVKRTPLSEACRGVVTVCSLLGLGQLLREAAAEPTGLSRLAPLREWFAQQEPEKYLERVFRSARLKVRAAPRRVARRARLSRLARMSPSTSWKEVSRAMGAPRSERERMFEGSSESS